MAQGLLELVFWTCAAGVFHTYFLYPFLLRVWSRRRPPLRFPSVPEAELPFVSVLMAVYNERAVIEQKMSALLALDYPPERLRIYVGSDLSTDGTKEILARYENHDAVEVWYAEARMGKPRIVNFLAEFALEHTPAGTKHLFLLTDANVFPEPDILQKLARPFQDARIGLVDSHMRHTGTAAGGIAASEDRYIRREVAIKQAESQLWRAMIGPFGGCFALRSDLFEPVPPHFKVDDFYLAMRTFERGYGAVNQLDAVCTETVGNSLRGEFRRKRRIGTGNFQNLLRFRRLWLRPWTAVGFALLSHKVLRWLVPVFILGAFLASAVLALWGRPLYQLALVVQLLLWFVLPALDWLLPGLHHRWSLPRHLRYFVRMNQALFLGLLDALGGVSDGTWEPVRG